MNADLFTALARPVAHDALVVLTLDAAAAPLEALLSAPIAGERLLWDSGEAAWAFAGVGQACRLVASGPRRTASLMEQAQGVFHRMVERSELHADLPRPRFFGGLAFHPQALHDEPWSAFGDASFVVPRWLYGRRGKRAFLRLALRADELGATTRVNDELSHINAALWSTKRHCGVRAMDITEMPRDTWDHLVTDALAAIRAGTFEKVVLARRSALRSKVAFDLAQGLTRLRALEPSCVRFAFEEGRTAFFGATPERLVAKHGVLLETEALAGSIARSDDDDDGARECLLASDKDRREHAFVLDGIRSALESMCRHLEVADEPVVRTLRNVHHLATPVRGHLCRPGHILELVDALHPTPAVAGLPRSAACAWIVAKEPCERGWYAGPVGWFDEGGDGAFVVALRSAVVRGLEAWVYAGAGIVEGSNAGHEYAETSLKQATMLSALGGLP